MFTIPAGQTSGSLVIPVIGNTIDQPNRTFFVVLDSAINGTIALGLDHGIATIVDDDGPHLSISALSPTIVEGNSGMTNAIFRVTVSGGGNPDGTSPKPTTVQYAT